MESEGDETLKTENQVDPAQGQRQGQRGKPESASGGKVTFNVIDEVVKNQT